MSEYFLYIVRCADNSLYIGVTRDVQKRLQRHNEGRGARWFLQHGLGVVVYTETFATLIEARRRETQLKKWSRKKKELLLRGFDK